MTENTLLRSDEDQIKIVNEIHKHLHKMEKEYFAKDIIIALQSVLITTIVKCFDKETALIFLDSAKTVLSNVERM